MSKVVEALSEEECALWAILSDPSGMDLAEFSWQDHEAEFGIWRAWPFQWSWLRNTQPLQIDQAARAIGKSISITMRAYAFPFIHPQQEMLVTAPELIHLNPLIGLIEHRFLNTRLGREMLPRNRNHGITHRPFEMFFLNGARIFGRIPQKTGAGVKGQHPLWLELDEAQNFGDAGWTELIETLKRGHDGAVWRAHGVTRGVRDFFYRFTQPHSGWFVHRITALHRPTWTDQERKEKIEMYGSREHPDYRRNVMGLHGDASNVIFVLHRLMACTDTNEASDYNTSEYRNIRINHEMVEDAGGNILSLLDFPSVHKETYKTFWIGMDVGLTQHPSEILVFAEIQPQRKPSHLKLLTRVHLERVSYPAQVEAVLSVIEFYDPKAFSVDKTGLGLPLFQELQNRSVAIAGKVKGYGFSEKILVEIDQTVEVDEYKGDVVKDAGIFKNVLEHATDVLRGLVDSGRVQLPWDTDLLSEFQGQTFCCDTATEILTNRGWLRYDAVRDGDFSVGLLPDGRADWTPVQAVHVFPAEERQMLSMEHVKHSSLTTLDHRWYARRLGKNAPIEVVTSRELNVAERPNIYSKSHTTENRWRIPIRADFVGSPNVAKYSDDFVELVAWFYTEGNWTKTRKINIAQSWLVNPANCERIEALLERMFGIGAMNSGRGCKSHGCGWSATFRDQGGSDYRVLDDETCVLLRSVLDVDKVVDPAFLVDLTQDQLRRFIDVSLLGDGCEFYRKGLRREFIQKHEGRVAVFEMACALAGMATRTRRHGTVWCVTVSTEKYTNSTSAIRQIVQYEGEVWCPETGTGNWLARRRGSVYFTGNTVVRDNINVYGRREYSKGKYHTLDAARMAALGWAQQPIEQFTKKEKHEPVADVFLSF